jgi:hypothetical protein
LEEKVGEQECFVFELHEKGCGDERKRMIVTDEMN